MNIKIIIAAHKPYRMPEDGIYLPLQVGAAGRDVIDANWARDDSGDNISEKNKNFCELTGLYWAWKNLEPECEYVGLAHYRRHFSAKGMHGDKWERVIDGKHLEKLLADNALLLPKPRNYFIETNYGQYVHAHHAEDLELTRKIISEKYPEYCDAFDRYMEMSVGHRFNMFIMRRDMFDSYCEWLFDILFELEKRLDISEYTPYDARVFGFVSERLLDVWIMGGDIDYAELPYVFMEKQNWFTKGFNFVKRKFASKK